jgi:hypothetical protein
MTLYMQSLLPNLASSTPHSKQLLRKTASQSIASQSLSWKRGQIPQEVLSVGHCS